MTNLFRKVLRKIQADIGIYRPYRILGSDMDCCYTYLRIKKNKQPKSLNTITTLLLLSQSIIGWKLGRKRNLVVDLWFTGEKRWHFTWPKKNPFNEFASSLFDSHRLISFKNVTNLDAWMVIVLFLFIYPFPYPFPPRPRPQPITFSKAPSEFQLQRLYSS